MNKTVSFTTLDRATKEDLEIIDDCFKAQVKGVKKRIIEALLGLRGNPMGYQIDRFEHSLQTATRALRDGCDDEMIVCALLHDIGDDLAPLNHGELAAAVLRPYVSEENAWTVKHHGILQSKEYLHEMKVDKNELEKKLRNHPAFERTIIFCRRWDRVSFDPNYDSLPLSTFEPMLERIFSQEVNCLS